VDILSLEVSGLRRCGGRRGGQQEAGHDRVEVGVGEVQPVGGPRTDRNYNRPEELPLYFHHSSRCATTCG
jgi:hypothetical protein